MNLVGLAAIHNALQAADREQNTLLALLGRWALLNGGKVTVQAQDLNRLAGAVNIVTDPGTGALTIVHTPAHQLPQEAQ